MQIKQVNFIPVLGLNNTFSFICTQKLTVKVARLPSPPPLNLNSPLSTTLK